MQDMVLGFIIMFLIFVFSTPIHELGHVICFRLLGYRGPLRVVWLDWREVFRFTFGRQTFGYVKAPRRIRLFRIFASNLRFSVFLLGFSGGAFSACVLACIALLAGKFFPLWLAFPTLAACITNIGFDFIHSVREGLQSERAQVL